MSNPPPRAPTFPKFIDQQAAFQTFESGDGNNFNNNNNNNNNDNNDSNDNIDNISDDVPLPDMDDDQFKTPRPMPTPSDAVPVVDLPVAGRRKSVATSVLLWRNPKVSAVCFASCMTLISLAILMKLPMVSALALLFAAYQLIGRLVVFVNKEKLKGKWDNYLKRPLPSTPLFKRDVAYQFADFVVDEGNDMQDMLRDILYCDKGHVTGVAVAMSLFLFVLGKYLHGTTVLMVVTVLLFTVPLLYEKNKKKVDDTIAKASDTMVRQVSLGSQMVTEKTSQIMKEAGPVARKYAEKVGITPTKSKAS